MTYVISSACVDVMHRSCVQDCPVDCIYEGARSLYINPDECVDCGACKLICEEGAIYYETDLPEDEQQHLTDNAVFFTDVPKRWWSTSYDVNSSPRKYAGRNSTLTSRRPTT